MNRPRSTRPDREPYDEGVRLDVYESPLGPPPGALDQLTRVAGALHRSPLGLSRQVVDQVARHCGTSLSAVVLTTGIDEAIDLLLADMDRLWSPYPGSPAYARRATALGKPSSHVPLDAEGRPRTDPRTLGSGGLVVLAQPNNPTGTLLDPEWVEALAQVAERVCVDETELDFADGQSFTGLISRYRSLCVYRDLARSLGLAGMRLGAILAAPELAQRIQARQWCDAIDSVALHSVLGALRDRGHQHALLRYLRTARASFLEALAASGLFVEVRDTHAGYVLGRCEDASSAAELVSGLAHWLVHVRDCTPHGMPGWVWVSVGSEGDLQRLRVALERLASARAPAARGVDRPESLGAGKAS